MGPGVHGISYSYIGAVVGATYPEMEKYCVRSCRKPTSWCRAMAPREDRAKTWCISSMRTAWEPSSIPHARIIAAYKQEKYASFGAEAFGDASRAAVADMIADISGALNG